MKALLTSDTHYGFGHSTTEILYRFWKKVAKTIEKENIDVVIWAGDIATSKQSEFKKAIAQARNIIGPQIPIAFVRGNHDLWDRGRVIRTFAQLEEEHNEIFSRYDIHHLEQGSMTIDNVGIFGWDGWYGTANPPSNDAYNMFKQVEGVPTHTFLSHRAWIKFEKVLEDVDLLRPHHRAAVAVTHFNPYTIDTRWENMCANLKFYDLIKAKFDVFCCGHNHQFKNRLEGTCRVVNAGSDYMVPKFLVFEV